MAQKKKLSDVPHFKGIDSDIACKIYIVGHVGNIRQYYTIAESRKVAALAYVAFLGAQNVAITLDKIWVRDESGVQSIPLIQETQESIHNWLDAKPQMRPKLIQAAVNHLHPIVTA